MQPIIIIGRGLAVTTSPKNCASIDKETPLTIIAADSGHF
jgi:hypothetical protein